MAVSMQLVSEGQFYVKAPDPDSLPVTSLRNEYAKIKPETSLTRSGLAGITVQITQLPPQRISWPVSISQLSRAGEECLLFV